MKTSLKMQKSLQWGMTFELHSALQILQMPQIDLALWLKEEIEKNPLVECTSPPSLSYLAFEEIPAPLTLHEHLLRQILEVFSSKQERQLAQNLLGYLDEKGFISSSAPILCQELCCKEETLIPVLQKLKRLHPAGIFAENLQESLLIQLRALGLESAPVYTWIEKHFADLIEGRWSALKKHCTKTTWTQSLKQLARLHLRPSQIFQDPPSSFLIPDLRIEKVGEQWRVEVLEEYLPSFSLQNPSLFQKIHSPEDKAWFRTHFARFKWISRSLERRRTLLEKIGKWMIKKQKEYLDEGGFLCCRLSKELAQELEIHESTLYRALSEKYVETPRGTLPLQLLISSSDRAHRAIQHLISYEDKCFPLTDHSLAQKLNQMGIPIARRTVAKYRRLLKLRSAKYRKIRVD